MYKGERKWFEKTMSNVSLRIQRAIVSVLLRNNRRKNLTQVLLLLNSE